jgi:hypothetical protein
LTMAVKLTLLMKTAMKKVLRRRSQKTPRGLWQGVV